MACLDTTLLIDLCHPHKKAGKNAVHKLIELVERGELLATTPFNVAELYVGVELAENRAEELDSVRRILAPMTVLTFGDRAQWQYAGITAHLRRIGRPVGDMDVLIAATAIAEGHCLVTRNDPHFTAIPHLVVETY